MLELGLLQVVVPFCVHGKCINCIHWFFSCAHAHWNRTILSCCPSLLADPTKPFAGDVPGPGVRDRPQTSRSRPGARSSGTLHMRSLPGAEHLLGGGGEPPAPS